VLWPAALWVLGLAQGLTPVSLGDCVVIGSRSSW
jgi:hypothetical protein